MNFKYAFVINLSENIGVVQKDQWLLRQVMRANNSIYLLLSGGFLDNRFPSETHCLRVGFSF